MAQKFRASPSHSVTHANGATGYAPGGSFDCLGPFAKVKNCPIVCDGVEGLRLTCYATGYSDTFFSVPACTRYKRQHIGGYFAHTEHGPEFRVYDRFKAKVLALSKLERLKPDKIAQD